MRFLMVRASQQNSKVGVGSLGSFQVLKEEYKELDYVPKGKKEKFQTGY